jgi:hypothetical protein
MDTAPKWMYRSGEPSHWYHPDGRPCYTQPNGVKTTLRHARKLGLLPSVTTCMRLLSRPAVEDWRVGQAIRVALTKGASVSSDNLDEHAARVAELLDRDANQASEFGSEIHEAIEYCNTHGKIAPEMSPLGKHTLFLKFYQDWFSSMIDQVLERETVLVNQAYGYAGRVDLIAIHRVYGLCIIDFKTQAIRNPGVPVVYDEWAFQLAAYSRAYRVEEPHPRCLSVIIDSTRPTVPVEHCWDPGDIEHGWTVFSNLITLWQSIKKYHPVEVAA